MRCFKYQKFGHGNNSCHSDVSVCGKYSGRGCIDNNCNSEVEKCLKCEGSHPPYSRVCPLRDVEEICAVEATSGVSYFEARRLRLRSPDQ